MNVLKRSRARAALLAPAAALMLFASAGTASANSSPGWGDDKPDVLSDCNQGNADLCQYHEINAWTSYGDWHESSNVFSNCSGTDNATFQIASAYATNTSYSYQQSTSVEVSAGFSDTIELGMKASTETSETWTLGDTRTNTQTVTSTVRPGYKGGYSFRPLVRHSQGWIEVHYGKRVDGHYYWYYPGQGSDGFRIDTPVAWSDGSLKGELKWETWKC